MTLAKVGDFSAPVYVTAPLGDTSRVFVVEQRRDDRARQGRRDLDLPRPHPRASLSGSERGLLSMAFALDYATNGLFYVYYTARTPTGQLTIEEHRRDPANPDRADPSYARAL